MKEKIINVLDSLQERFKSPFLITYFLVWLVHHWKLIFIVTNFDTDLNQGYKLSLIEGYINVHGGWFGMIIPSLWWSLLSIIIYYIIVVAVKNITNGYYWFLALTYVWTREKRKLKTDEEFREMELMSKRQQKRIEELNTQNLNYNEQLSSVNSQLNSKILDISKLEKNAAKFSAEKQEVVEQSETFKKFYEKNREFQMEATQPLLWLMAEKFKIDYSELNKAIITNESRDTLDGIWAFRFYATLQMNSYNEIKYRIDGNNIYELPTKKFYGHIKDFSFEKMSKILLFNVEGNSDKISNFKLIQMNSNKLMGFKDDLLITFNRLESDSREVFPN